MNSSTLTFDKLLDIEKELHKVYYAVDNYNVVAKGEIIIVKAQKFTPQFFLCHPDDLEMIKENLPEEKELCHIRDYYNES